MGKLLIVHAPFPSSIDLLLSSITEVYCALDLFFSFEATRRIRVMERDLNERVERGELPPECANIRRWHTPILAMTADVIQATHEHCLKSEMDGYVYKPFEGEQLYREVTRFFQNHDQVQ